MALCSIPTVQCKPTGSMVILGNAVINVNTKGGGGPDLARYTLISSTVSVERLRCFVTAAA